MPGITLAVAIVTVMVTRADPDLWGHLRFGADILRTHALASVDPYSFTSDRPWVNHEWLSEVLFALAYRIGGSAALIVLKLLLTGMACVLLVGIARGDGVRTSALVFMGGLAVAAMLPRASQIRPQLLSVVCFAILMALLRAADRGQARRLVWVPPLMVVWANAHGSWLVGCATLGCWAVGYIWMRRGDGRRAWVAPAACVVAAVAATLVTPYGNGLWTFLYETVGPTRAFIPEWGPITGDPIFLGTWIIFWILLVAAIRRGGIPSNPALLVIPLAWGLAAARVSRLDTFFEMSVLACRAAPLGAVLEGRSRSPDAHAAAPSPWAVAGVAAVLVALALGLWPRLRCIEVWGRWTPEPQAVGFIRARHLQGRMITFFDWGEYAIWFAPPGLQISMDGRRETVYTAATIDGHVNLYLGTPAGLAYARGLNADYIWLPKVANVLDSLQHAGWTAVFKGPASVILARAGSGIAPMVVSSPDRPSRCFPGP